MSQDCVHGRNMGVVWHEGGALMQNDVCESVGGIFSMYGKSSMFVWGGLTRSGANEEEGHMEKDNNHTAPYTPTVHFSHKALISIDFLFHISYHMCEQQG